MKIWHIPKHIQKINDELGELAERVAKLEADMAWIKWMTLTILGGIIALLIKTFFFVP